MKLFLVRAYAGMLLFSLGTSIVTGLIICQNDKNLDYKDEISPSRQHDRIAFARLSRAVRLFADPGASALTKTSAARHLMHLLKTFKTEQYKNRALCLLSHYNLDIETLTIKRDAGRSYQKFLQLLHRYVLRQARLKGKNTTGKDQKILTELRQLYAHKLTQEYRPYADALLAKSGIDLGVTKL